MHIAIHTGSMSGGHSARGIGLYTKELIDALTQFETAHTYSFFTQPHNIASKADVIHYPSFDPFFLTLPWSKPKPTVVTVHDLIPIAYPKEFPRGVRGGIKWQIQKYFLKRVSSQIITDSNASKTDIVHLAGIDPEIITSVPLAARSAIKVIEDKKMLSEVRKKYNLNNKYVLYVGDVNWNKNILRILDAFSQCDKIDKKQLQLVLVGKAFLKSDLIETQQIHAHIEKLGIGSAVLTPGFVPDEDLAALYTMAEVLLYPSVAEGFGFPVLEALSCGCPVITSSTSSLQEIAGPSVVVDPTKTQDIREGLDMVLSWSSEKRNEMVKKSFAWTTKYTWKKVASETVKVYEKAFSHNTGI
jgi:glycosyltransferase involved in cell wall biosynthesis